VSRAWLVLLVVASLLACPLAQEARADGHEAAPAAKSMLAPSPLVEEGSSVVPGAAPSREHRWGTVVVYGIDILDPVTQEQAIVGVEWDLFAKSVVRRVEVERMPFATGTVRAARVGDETFLVFGSVVGADAATLYALDAAGHLVEKIALSDGDGPAIAANESFVVVGLYEKREPVLAPDHATGWQPRSVYHVRVFDRATRRIVGARVFRGDVLLAAKWHKTRQALALQAGRVFVALPMIDNARLIAARLPSLATEAQLDLEVPHEPEASSSLAAYNGGIVALTDDFWFELSPDLAVKKRRALPGLSAAFVAIEPHTNRLFVDGDAPPGLAATSAARHALYAQSLTWAWGHAVALGASFDEPPVPTLLVVP